MAEAVATPLLPLRKQARFILRKILTVGQICSPAACEFCEKGTPVRTRRNGRIGWWRFAVPSILAISISACATLPQRRDTGFRHPVAITWNDTAWCVPWRLRRALAKISRHFGPITVHSTHRWPIENWIKGGKRKSYHLSCRAVDFSVAGDPSDVIRYLRSLDEVGGYSRYEQGFYHIDTGPRRTW